MLASTFVLLLVSIFSLMVSRIFPRISVNYVSTFIGILCGVIPFIDHRIEEFHSEIFMLLIIAPLLFFEGFATPFGNLRHKLKQIIGITVVMVLLSTVVAGVALHLAVGVSLPLAFVMAAISTPTDATATSSVSMGLTMPKKPSEYLRLESLFNDASGLILLQATALWLVNGQFSYQKTALDFLVSALGGIFVGVICCTIVMLFRQRLLRTLVDSLTVQLLLYVLTPYIIYLIAEELHVSGILAVVVAGIMHNSEARVSLFVDARLSFISRSVTDIMNTILNSMVFVIFGIMVVRVMREYLSLQNIAIWGLSGVLLYIAALVVRYLYARYKLKETTKNAVVFALGGVHGAVTLALVFSLLDLGVSGNEFSLILMAEFILIILSMLVPTIVFRFILPKKQNDATILANVARIRHEMVEAAIKEVDKMHLPKRAKDVICMYLRDQAKATSLREFNQRFARALQIPEIQNDFYHNFRYRIFTRCFAVERAYLQQAVEEGRIEATYAAKLYQEVVLAEAMLVDNREEE
ncbi:sodium:proton antiporter [uncultured Ligilactobacillus sp.]|uniref:cation:proton antiporter n=1 Tax=uncultured Ligilactobacillus sp. TaxID=2837633 RepID=UPI00272CF9E9|nr:sodium:proton antiporter [uncultured Ligilactobacillus sp.]